MANTTYLKAVMGDENMSLRRLAGVLGVSYQAVWRWQRGEARPHPTTGAKLEALTGLPLDVLMAPQNTNGDAPRGVAAKSSGHHTAEVPTVTKKENTDADQSSS